MQFSNKFVPRKRKYIEYMKKKLAKKNKEKRTNERTSEWAKENLHYICQLVTNKSIKL